MPESELRNHLRRLRFENGEMTQQELADRAGCTRQTIGALEQGKYVPSLVLAVRIARVFGVRVEEVFEVSDQGGPPASHT
ncbi:MAG: helix-turn-helix transcriptional regulator [Gemmatimonadales bacterium]|jgi:putative transcriptional regulator